MGKHNMCVRCATQHVSTCIFSMEYGIRAIRRSLRLCVRIVASFATLSGQKLSGELLVLQSE